MNTRRRSLRLRSRSNSKHINGFLTPEKQIISDDNGLLLTPDSISSASNKLNIVKKRLFDDTENGNNNKTSNSSLKTPCKRQQLLPISPAPSPQKLVFGKDSIYSKTKSLLQRSAGLFASETGCLVTREEQFDKIIDFLDSNMSNNTSSSLYITGPPGTGKTAQLNSIIKNKLLPIDIPQGKQSIHKQRSIDYHDNKNKNKHNNSNIEVFPNLKNQCYFQLSNGQNKSVVATLINCIALSEPNMVFNQIYESFNTADNTKKPVKTTEGLKRYMESFGKRITFLVILDEIDKLLYSSNNDTMATKIILDLFLLAKSPSLNLLLIGVANSLDLKDRFLSRLNLKQDLLPSTIVFYPYSSEEMCKIVMDRIKTVKMSDNASADVDAANDCIFNPVAIKFASKKCSGSTGDIRKLFDVLRSSIELVELEVVKQVKTKTAIEGGDSIRTASSGFKLIKVGMPHVAKVFAQINNNVSTRSRIARLNMQQRIILCSLVNRESFDVFHNSCSLDAAYDYYKQFLQRRDSVMKPLNRNEFIEIANNLETCGVVTMSHGRATGRTKHVVKMIQTSIDKNEFEEEIRKMDILKRFV